MKKLTILGLILLLCLFVVIASISDSNSSYGCIGITGVLIASILIMFNVLIEEES